MKLGNIVKLYDISEINREKKLLHFSSKFFFERLEDKTLNPEIRVRVKINRERSDFRKKKWGGG